MKIFDCHSHWGTRRGYIFRTEEELAQQEKIWKTKATFLTEEEMVAYFRKNNAKVILDLSFTKFLPIEEIRAASRSRVRSSAPATRMRSSAIGCSSIRAARWNRSASSTAPWPPTAASSDSASMVR